MKEAFRFFQLKLTAPPALTFSGSDRPFLLGTVAFCLSFGSSVVRKKKDGKDHLVQAASRAMSSSEEKSAFCEREASADVSALRKIKVYVSFLISCAVVNERKGVGCTI